MVNSRLNKLNMRIKSILFFSLLFAIVACNTKEEDKGASEIVIRDKTISGNLGRDRAVTLFNRTGEMPKIHFFNCVFENGFTWGIEPNTIMDDLRFTFCVFNGELFVLNQGELKFPPKFIKSKFF